MMWLFPLLLAFQGMPAANAGVTTAPQVDSISLTLPEAVDRAIRIGDESRTAAAQVDVADAQVTTARAAGLPQLRLNGSQSHVIQSARASAVGQIFNQPNTYNA